MLRYSSERHRKLMNASEYALQDATESAPPRESRIASTILGDDKKYKEWELRHANLLLPVAEHRQKKYQVLELRSAEMQLVHRRALFTYLQTHTVSESKRKELFRLYHTTLDFHDAVLTEHRHYMVAVSSHISTDHIIDVMDDYTSTSLLEQYEKTFSRYFEMKCYIACARDGHTVGLVRNSLRDLQAQLLRIRRRVQTSPPEPKKGSFEKHELLSRTGRHEIRNYLFV